MVTKGQKPNLADKTGFIQFQITMHSIIYRRLRWQNLVKPIIRHTATEMRYRLVFVFFKRLVVNALNLTFIFNRSTAKPPLKTILHKLFHYARKRLLSLQGNS